MRNLIFTLLLIMAIAGPVAAQRSCNAFDYEQQNLQNDPSLRQKLADIENFAKRKSILGAKPHEGKIITIPVVVHILYNKAGENISDEKVFSQIAILNECFRRLSADTVNTPAWFKDIAADCGIEFKLATSDPQRRATTGIVRKYTPVTKWDIDDQVKSSARAGADPWDTQNYLNIWVCNLDRVAGYSSFPGGPEATDGIVIAYTVFGKSTRSGYEQGKTAVHEMGHWLGLRHIWGDGYCGDDWVDDTPKQGNFTPGCPSGIRPSCSNGKNGDMYMNYMDLTQDACINLFTEGQKERMRTFFEEGFPRYSLLSSYGLNAPTNNEPAPPEEVPLTSEYKLYPNPATNEILLDLSYDIRWMGQTIRITNIQGQFVMQVPVNAKVVKLDISKLTPGLYFLMTKKDDGATIKQKFIKM
jgi:hypothetical protein